MSHWLFGIHGLWLFVTPRTVAHQAPRSSIISQSLIKFMSIELVMLSNHVILCHLLLLLPSIFLNIRGFSNESAFPIRWPKYQSSSISPSNEYSGLIYLRMNCFGLFSVQETLESLLWHHYSKASILQRSAFFMVQLSHLSMTTGKTIALTTWTFVSKVMSLLFDTLSRFVIAFLSRSKCLLISWLQSLFTVILEPQKRKSVTASTFSPSICREVMGLGATVLVFWMLSFKPAFPLSSFTLINSSSSVSSSLSAFRVVSSAYLKLLVFLLAILIPACDSSSPAFHMMYSACTFWLTSLHNRL